MPDTSRVAVGVLDPPDMSSVQSPARLPAAPPARPTYPASAPKPSSDSKNTAGTVGGVIGITGFVLSWIPILGIFVGIPMGILAIIFGGVGMSRADVPKGMAVTGLVLGILTVIFKLIPGFNLL
jgi:hypothetical protein